MTQLEFLAAVIKAAAWPLTVLILGLVFRRSLARVIESVSRFKVKEVELEFKRELQAIAASVPEAAARNDAATRSSPSLNEEIRAVSEVSPRAAIPLAWAELESELREAVLRSAKDVAHVPLYGFDKRIYVLREKGLIDTETVDGIKRLRDLRNRVVHGDLSVSKMSESDAWNYAELAQRVTTRLREIK